MILPRGFPGSSEEILKEPQGSSWDLFQAEGKSVWEPTVIAGKLGFFLPKYNIS